MHIARPILTQLILLVCLHLIEKVTHCQEYGTEEKWPTISMCILVRNKAHTLPYFLTLLQQLDYPKERISLWIRSDHNEDESIEILKVWFMQVKDFYHDINMELKEDGEKNIQGEHGPAHWPQTRFEHIIYLRERGMEHAKNMWADYLMMLDADVFLTYKSVLKDLVLKKLHIAAPVLKSEGLYSNFWCGMTDEYYYKRTEDYKPILYRERKGCFNVPMVHSVVLINLNKIASEKLTYNPRNLINYTGPRDDIITFAVSANLSGIPLMICNENHYGYVMTPLEQKDPLYIDYQQLVNIKVDSIVDDVHIVSDQVFEKYLKFPKVDKLGLNQVYMINLLRRPDRKIKMEASFSELGIDAVKWEAVDGREMNKDKIEKLKISFLPNYEDPYHHRPMTYGEIGCFLSHYTIWEDVIKNGYDKVLVLEDDVRFEPYFRRKLEFIQDELEQNRIDWDLIYIGRKWLQEEEEKKVSPSIVKASYSYWTIGYLLSKSGASKLINADPLRNLLPVDEFLPILAGVHTRNDWSKYYPVKNLKMFSASPLLIYPTHYVGEEGYISDTENSDKIMNSKEEL